MLSMLDRNLVDVLEGVTPHHVQPDLNEIRGFACLKFAPVKALQINGGLLLTGFESSAALRDVLAWDYDDDGLTINAN